MPRAKIVSVQRESAWFDMVDQVVGLEGSYDPECLWLTLDPPVELDYPVTGLGECEGIFLGLMRVEVVHPIRRPEYKRKYGTIARFKEFEKLIAEVREVDPEAANYLAEMGQEGLNIKNFGYSRGLASCMIFSRTPQGHRYWWDVENKL